MSLWTHACCATCFTHITNRPSDKAVRIVAPEPETCCFCGIKTDEGIFIRHEQLSEMFCDHE